MPSDIGSFFPGAISVVRTSITTWHGGRKVMLFSSRERGPIPWRGIMQRRVDFDRLADHFHEFTAAVEIELRFAVIGTDGLGMDEADMRQIDEILDQKLVMRRDRQAGMDGLPVGIGVAAKIGNARRIRRLASPIQIQQKP